MKKTKMLAKTGKKGNTSEAKRALAMRDLEALKLELVERYRARRGKTFPCRHRVTANNVKVRVDNRKSAESGGCLFPACLKCHRAGIANAPSNQARRASAPASRARGRR